MLDNIEIIIVTVVAGLVLVALKPYGPRIVHWIVWRWRRYRARRDQRRAQREQDLNVFVDLTTGELIHRGCAGRKDEIEREGFIPLGRCVRCGEHGRSPRA